jgi:uncharacterized RDD family membrane protein YckC
MELEDRLTIETPEGVELDLTLAGIGSRFTASLIDHTLQFTLVIAAVLALGELGSLGSENGQTTVDDGGGALAVAVLTLFGFAIFFAYDLLFEVRFGGRTPGKRLTGLRVVRTGGRPVGFVTSAIRNLLRVVDVLPGFYGVAMAVMFASKRNQRLGDLAAGTVVVRERKGGRTGKRDGPDHGASEPGPRLDTAGWDVSAVSAQDIATVRRFLERRGALADDARGRLADELAGRLRPLVAGAPDVAAERFLEALSAAKASRAAP